MSGIIVVEDDQLIRALLVEWLSAEGYAVRAYGHGDVLPPDDPDLLMIDVFMPRQGGWDKVRGVRATHPRTPMIAISGQFVAGLHSSDTARALGVRRVIGKPFSRGQLLRAVRDVIGSGGP